VPAQAAHQLAAVDAQAIGEDEHVAQVGCGEGIGEHGTGREAAAGLRHLHAAAGDAAVLEPHRGRHHGAVGHSRVADLAGGGTADQPGLRPGLPQFAHHSALGEQTRVAEHEDQLGPVEPARARVEAARAVPLHLFHFHLQP
jgi:hypothetical protein